MTQRTRILFAVAALVLLVGAVLAVEALRRGRSGTALTPAGPGSIPIYLDGRLVGGFQPGDLERLDTVRFVEAEEGKTEEGWLLRDVILLYVQPESLQHDSRITVSSTSRDKSAQATWAEADEVSNFVMFDLSNRGTLKFVSAMERLGTRDKWVHDADRIDVESP